MFAYLFNALFAMSAFFNWLLASLVGPVEPDPEEVCDNPDRFYSRHLGVWLIYRCGHPARYWDQEHKGCRKCLAIKVRAEVDRMHAEREWELGGESGGA